MSRTPEPLDVVKITGHTLHEGGDLHGMFGFVDAVEFGVATLHVDNEICGIHARIEDLHVIYRIGRR